MPAKHPPLPGTLASVAESGVPVFIVCIHCKRIARPDYLLIARIVGWAAMIDDVARRLRCKGCKQRGAKFTVTRPRGRMSS
jgi:hypothetical protein